MQNYNVRVEKLEKSYGKKKILKGIDFTAEKGEIIGVIGKNGAGKSTFLEILMTIKDFDDGKVIVFGENLKEINQAKLRKIKNNISAVLQPTQFYKKLKVKELLDLFRSYYGGKVNINEIIEEFELGEQLNTFFDNLSGGWKQRVSLAIAFLSKPSLIILDEPTTGLDPYMRNLLWENITNYIKKNDSTIILSTHYMDEIEMYCDKVLFLNNGVNEVFDTPENILKSGHKSINSFYLDKITK
ncbi:ABC transporter ATP-binding protein [Dellaglioa sp. L3N]